MDSRSSRHLSAVPRTRQSVRAWDIEERLRELRDVLRELGDDQPEVPAAVPVPARAPIAPALTDRSTQSARVARLDAA